MSDEWYIDEDGKYYRADEVDLDVHEIVEEEDGFGENVIEAAKEILAGADLAAVDLSRGVGGMVQNVEEMLPEKLNFGIGKGIRESVEPFYQRRVKETQDIEEDSVRDYATSASRSISQYAPLAAIPGVGPLGLAALYGLNIFGQKYGEYRDQGVEPPEAGMGASVPAASTAILNRMLPFQALGSKLPWYLKYPTTGVAEGIEEMLEVPGESVGEQLATGRVSSLEEDLSRMGRGFKHGFVSGNVMQGGHDTIGHFASKSRPEDLSEFEEAFEEDVAQEPEVLPDEFTREQRAVIDKLLHPKQQEIDAPLEQQGELPYLGDQIEGAIAGQEPGSGLRLPDSETYGQQDALPYLGDQIAGPLEAGEPGSGFRLPDGGRGEQRQIPFQPQGPPDVIHAGTDTIYQANPNDPIYQQPGRNPGVYNPDMNLPAVRQDNLPTEFIPEAQPAPPPMTPIQPLQTPGQETFLDPTTYGLEQPNIQTQPPAQTVDTSPQQRDFNPRSFRVGSYLDETATLDRGGVPNRRYWPDQKGKIIKASELNGETFPDAIEEMMQDRRSDVPFWGDEFKDVNNDYSYEQSTDLESDVDVIPWWETSKKKDTTEVAPEPAPQPQETEIAKTPEPAPAPQPQAQPQFDGNLALSPEPRHQDAIQTALVQKPVEQIAAGEIAVRPALMQFKSVEDVAKGTNSRDKLKGVWDDLKAGNLLLWEPKNPEAFGLLPGQRYIIANGHHRFEHGEDLGVQAYNTQIIREADGITAEHAKSLAAEINIADGKGNVFEQAKFLRNQASLVGQDGSMARGREIGIGQRRSARIAYMAAPETWDQFINETITPAHAEAISKAVPSDEGFQRIGIKQAKSGESPQFIEDSLRALKFREENGELFMPETKGIQGDIFGSDPKAQEVIAAAEAEAEIVQGIRREIKGYLRSVQGAVTNPDRAKAMNLPVNDPDAITAKITELKALEEGLKTWWTNPELKKAVADKKSDSLLRKIIDDEGGIGNIFPQTFRDFKEKLGTVFVPEGRKIQGERGTRYETPIGQRFSQGRVDVTPKGLLADPKYPVRIPGVSKVISGYRDWFVFESTLADKFPDTYGPIHDISLRSVYNRDRNNYKAMETLSPYVHLKDKARVNKLLIAARIKARKGIAINESPQALARMRIGPRQEQLTPEEIEAYTAVRQSMEEATELIAEGLLADPPSWTKLSENHYAKFEQQVGELVEKWKTEKYVPFSRFGKRFVYIKQTRNSEGHLSFHETIESFLNKRRELNEAGQKHLYGEVNKPKKIKEAYHGMPADIVARLSGLDEGAGNVLRSMTKDKVAPEGFSKHLIEAQLIPGFEQGLDRSIADYLYSLSNWNAQKRANLAYDQAIASIPKYENYLANRAQESRDYMQTYTPEGRQVRQVLALWYLTRPVSAFVNGTQSLTTTLPMLTKYDGAKAPVTYLKAMQKGAQYLKNKTEFTQQNPELAADVKVAFEEGVLAEEATRHIAGMKRGKGDGTSVSDIALLMFSTAEKTNRFHAFFAAHDIATRRGMSGSERLKFAEGIVNQTQFIYSKANRPKIARGYKAMPMAFRLFPGNWLRLLRNNLGPGDKRVAGLMLAHMIAMGGVAAAPFTKEVIKGLEAAGYDPRRAVRGKLPDGTAEEVFFNGLPHLLGLNISGNISFGELAPGVEQGVAGAAFRGTLGVMADYPQRIGRAKQAFDMGLNRQGIEQLVPPVARNLSEAARWATRGKIEDSRGRVLLEDPTTWEVATRGMGFTPPRLAKRYEERHSKDLLLKRAQDNQHINFKLAKALVDKDKELYKQILRENAERNKALPQADRIHPSAQGIKYHMLSIKNPDMALRKRMPKKARRELLEIEDAYQ